MPIKKKIDRNPTDSERRQRPKREIKKTSKVLELEEMKKIKDVKRKNTKKKKTNVNDSLSLSEIESKESRFEAVTNRRRLRSDDKESFLLTKRKSVKESRLSSKTKDKDDVLISTTKKESLKMTPKKPGIRKKSGLRRSTRTNSSVLRNRIPERIEKDDKDKRTRSTTTTSATTTTTTTKTRSTTTKTRNKSRIRESCSQERLNNDNPSKRRKTDVQESSGKENKTRNTNVEKEKKRISNKLDSSQILDLLEDMNEKKKEEEENITSKKEEEKTRQSRRLRTTSKKNENKIEKKVPIYANAVKDWNLEPIKGDIYDQNGMEEDEEDQEEFTLLKKRKRKIVRRKKRKQKADIILAFGDKSRNTVAPIVKTLKNLKTPPISRNIKSMKTTNPSSPRPLPSSSSINSSPRPLPSTIVHSPRPLPSSSINNSLQPLPSTIVHSPQPLPSTIVHSPRPLPSSSINNSLQPLPSTIVHSPRPLHSSSINNSPRPLHSSSINNSPRPLHSINNSPQASLANTPSLFVNSPSSACPSIEVTTTTTSCPLNTTQTNVESFSAKEPFKSYKTPAVPKHIAKMMGNVSTPRQEEEEKKPLPIKEQVKMCFGFTDSENDDSNNDDSLVGGISPVRKVIDGNPYASPAIKQISKPKPTRFVIPMSTTAVTRKKENVKPLQRHVKPSSSLSRQKTHSTVDPNTTALFDDPVTEVDSKSHQKPVFTVIKDANIKVKKKENNNKMTKYLIKEVEEFSDDEKGRETFKEPTIHSKNKKDECKVYKKHNLEVNISPPSPKWNKKEKKELSKWETTQSSHFSEIDEFDLSFV